MTGGKRPQRWRYESRGRQLVVERERSTGRLFVLVVAPALRRAIWQQLPDLPTDLVPRVRAVTVRGLMAGRTEVPRRCPRCERDEADIRDGRGCGSYDGCPGVLE